MGNIIHTYKASTEEIGDLWCMIHRITILVGAFMVFYYLLLTFDEHTKTSLFFSSFWYLQRC